VPALAFNAVFVTIFDQDTIAGWLLIHTYIVLATLRELHRIREI